MQNNIVKVIAVTGGIGSGKSLAMEILKKAGYYTVSCDEIVDELYGEQQFLIELKKLFPLAVSGTERLTADKSIIAKEVFTKEGKLKQLNKLTHKTVVNRALSLAKEHGKNLGIAFVEVPLLFESKTENVFDGIMVVIRNKEDRIKSVIDRSGLTKEQVEIRINVQVDYGSLDLSKYTVINNDKGKLEFEKEILQAIKNL